MYSFCPSSCENSLSPETNSKWIEFNGKLYRTSDVSIGANVFPDSKLYIDGNLTLTGNLQTNGFYFGNVALAQGLPSAQDSKWNENSGNIFRDSLVSIGQNSVNTSHDLFVNGNANITLGVESPFLLTTGNVNCQSLNVSGNVDASYFKGDAGGLGNCTGGVGSRWIETIDGKLFVNKNVGIKTSDPYETLTINGNVIIDENLKINNNSQIIMNNGSIFIENEPNSVGSALQVGGQEGNLISGNFINQNQLHTTLNSYLSHCSIGGEENIKFAVLAIRNSGDFDTIINTIDTNFIVNHLGSGFFEIRTSDTPKSIPDGKRVCVMTQCNNQAGFNYANVVQSLPILTTAQQIFFNVQTGEFSGFSLFKGMSNTLKPFFCLIWLNDF